MIYEGKYCAIINRFTNKVLVAGCIVNHKDVPIHCISFDNRYFFNLKKTFLYKIVFLKEGVKVPFDPSKHKIRLWREVKRKRNDFIYRDFDEGELDKEIEDLVHSLNDLGYITTGSCCGHGYKQAYIDIKFNSLESINFLLNVLFNSKFKSKFYLTTEPRLCPVANTVIFTLKSYNIGKSAYKDMQDLADYLTILKDEKI